jgi:hypothetical protein
MSLELMEVAVRIVCPKFERSKQAFLKKHIHTGMMGAGEGGNFLNSLF